MKNYFSLLLATLALTTFVSGVNAQNTPPKPPVVTPVTIKTQPTISTQVILDLVAKEMKKDKVYTRSTGTYLSEFNKIVVKSKTQEARAKAFAILDKKYPKTSAQVKKYFKKIDEALTPKEAPLILDTPPINYQKEYYALLDEMKAFVLQLQKSKMRLETLEKKIDDMRR